MIKFADQVSTIILHESPLDQLHKVRLVLPSLRSINLIKKSLIKKIDGSCILPEMATINVFIVSISDLKKINPLDTHLTLVKVLQEVDKKSQFNINIYDLKQLLNDLNTIDNYVINKKEFFQDLNGFGELDNWQFKTKENVFYSLQICSGIWFLWIRSYTFFRKPYNVCNCSNEKFN